MIWLAAAAAMVCAGLLAWRAQNWFAPALRRYREVYTQDASVRLSEVFLFIDPRQLWVGAVGCGVAAAVAAFTATGSALVAVLFALPSARLPRMVVEGLRRRRAR